MLITSTQNHLLIYGTNLMQRCEHMRVRVEPHLSPSVTPHKFKLPLTSFRVIPCEFEHYTYRVVLYLSIQVLVLTRIASDRVSITSAELLDKAAM